MSKQYNTESDNHNLLRKLEPLPITQQETVNPDVKAKNREERELSIPVGSATGQGQIGPLVFEHEDKPTPADHSKPQPAPFQEKKDPEEVNPSINIEQLKELNGLDYPIIKESGVVELNRYEKFMCNARKHIATASKQAEINIKMRTNENQYICGKTSYIKFKLNISNDSNNVNFGSGSVSNIFKRISLKLPNGQLLDLCDKINIYSHVVDRWIKGVDYRFSGAGELKGFNQEDELKTVEDYYVMLSDLSPVFNTDSLLPASLTNNIEFVIELEKPDVAFSRVDFVGVAPAANALEYSISNIYFGLNSYYLDYEFHKMIKDKPLTLEYISYEMKRVMETSFNINVDLDVSAKSRVINVFNRVLQADLNADDILNYDRLACDTFGKELKNVRYYVGDLSYPNYELDFTERYLHNAQSLNILDRYSNIVSFEDYENFDYTDILDLKRSKFNIEGMPIDHTNLIRFIAEHPDEREYEMYFFVMYMKRLNIIPPVQNDDVNNKYAKFEIFQ